MSVVLEITNFFKSYGEAFRDGNRLSTFYGDCAMASTPAFVGCLKGTDEVRAALTFVAQEQIRTGMRSLAPLQVEVTNVDPLHSWARVHWGAIFERTGDRLIEFDISYLIRRADDRFVILFYVSHQDEQMMRKELGIV